MKENKRPTSSFIGHASHNCARVIHNLGIARAQAEDASDEAVSHELSNLIAQAQIFAGRLRAVRAHLEGGHAAGIR